MGYEEVEFLGFVKGLFFDKNKESLVVFLPAANGLSVHPRYPRFKWAKKLIHRSSVLYLSDPYQGEAKYREAKGSWYISDEPRFILPDLARDLILWVKERGIKNIIFYGSSMGGYASVVLSSFIQGSVAIAECPQLILRNHIGSRYILERVAGDDNKFDKKVDPLKYVRKSKAKKIIMTCSIHDRHYRKHIVPFLNMFSNSGASVDLELLLYSRPDLGKGHIALPEHEALNLIGNQLELLEK